MAPCKYIKALKKDFILQLDHALPEGKKLPRDKDGSFNLRARDEGRLRDKTKKYKEHHIDALAGATLTSNGVDNLVKFWMGKNGFKKFLNNLKNGAA